MGEIAPLDGGGGTGLNLLERLFEVAPEVQEIMWKEASIADLRALAQTSSSAREMALRIVGRRRISSIHIRPNIIVDVEGVRPDFYASHSLIIEYANRVNKNEVVPRIGPTYDVMFPLLKFLATHSTVNSFSFDASEKRLYEICHYFYSSYWMSKNNKPDDYWYSMFNNLSRVVCFLSGKVVKVKVDVAKVTLNVSSDRAQITLKSKNGICESITKRMRSYVYGSDISEMERTMEDEVHVLNFSVSGKAHP